LTSLKTLTLTTLDVFEMFAALASTPIKNKEYATSGSTVVEAIVVTAGFADVDDVAVVLVVAVVPGVDVVADADTATEAVVA